jgi:hypothetical protein
MAKNHERTITEFRDPDAKPDEVFIQYTTAAEKEEHEKNPFWKTIRFGPPRGTAIPMYVKRSEIVARGFKIVLGD